MIDPALIKLFRLLIRAWARRMLRGAKTWRGRFLLAFLVIVGLMCIVPSILGGIMLRDKPDQSLIGAMYEPYFPVLLMGLCLTLAFTSAGERAVYFSPAEVNFLFAAPFSRRDLLIYKLSRTLIGVVILAVFMATTQWILFHSWLAAFVGLTLALIFLQLTAMATAMIGQWLAEAAYTKARKILLAALLVAVAVGMAQAFAWSGKGNLNEMIAKFAGTAPGRVVLAPFQVFAHAAFAREIFPGLLSWGAAGLAINVGVLLLILKLDADYLEMAASVSDKMYTRIRRLRQGGGFTTTVTSTAGRLRLPLLPWLRGVGPVAWRQLLLVLRTSRQIVVMSLSLCSIMLLGMIFSSPGGVGARIPMTAGISLIGYLTFLFAMQAPWAFRGDIDRMDWIKMLPATPLAIATGELVGGIVLLAVIQCIVLAAMAAITPATAGWALVAALFCGPLNTVLLASSNLLFLLYPVRAAMGASFDLQTFGRIMLSFLFQSILLLPTLGIPALFGAVAFIAFDWSEMAFAVTAWLLLVAELPLLLIAVAWAFERFDPSLHTPPED